MACPTCDHTMQSIGVRELYVCFHCSRCGTVAVGNTVYVPRYVQQIRKIMDAIDKISEILRAKVQP